MSKSVLFQITAFEITNCLGREEPRQDAILKSLSGFTEWVNLAKHVEDTLIEGSQGVYVKDVAHSNSTFAVVLWKRNSVRNTTYALSKNDPPNGTASISRKKFDADFIPGDPLYFVISSARKRLYTLRPPFAIRTGRVDLEDAVKFYITHHSEFVKRRTKMENGIETVSRENGSSWRPVFKSKLVKNEAAIKEIIEKRESIRKLVKEVSLKSHDKAARDRFLRPVVAMFSVKLAEDEFDNARKVRCEVDVGLNEEQIQRIVDKQENAPDSQRIGFKFKKDQTIHWADTCIDREKIMLAVNENSEVFSAKALLAAFIDHYGE